MHWGHSIHAQGKRLDVTRAEFNASFGAETPPEPEVPECAMHAWGMWWRLNSRRPSSEFVCPIPFAEVESFSRLTNTIITPEDISMIEAIDNAYISACAEERKGQMDRLRDESTRGGKK